MTPIYCNKLKAENDIDKLTKVLSIFSMIKNFNVGKTDKRVHLRAQVVRVLAYYMLFGYSTETKELLEAAGFSKANVHMINSELRSLGYLLKDPKNFHNGFLSDEILRIRDYFMQQGKLFVIEIVE